MSSLLNDLLFAELESSYLVGNTTPAAGSAIRVLSPITHSPSAQVTLSERPVVGTLGHAAPVFGGRLETIEFTVELKAGPAVDQAPEWGVLLRACGCAETITATTQVAYGPGSTGHPSARIWYYNAQGVLNRMDGCRGNCVITATAGQTVKAAFTFTGHAVAVSDTSAPSASFDSSLPLPYVGSTVCTINGFNPKIAEVSLDLGNNVSIPPNANAADGFGEIQITQRAPKVTLEPELELVATKNWFASNFEDNTGAALAGALVDIGSTPNRITLNMLSGKVVSVGAGDRENIRTQPLEIALYESAGDDEWSLVLS